MSSQKKELSKKQKGADAKCKEPGFFAGKGLKIFVFFLVFVCYLLWNAYAQVDNWGTHMAFIVVLMMSLAYSCAKTHPIVEMLTILLVPAAAYFAYKVLNIEAMQEYVEIVFSRQQVLMFVVYHLFLIMVIAMLDKSRFRVQFLYTWVMLIFVALMFKGMRSYGDWPTHHLHGLSWSWIIPIWVISIGLAFVMLRNYFEDEDPVSGTLYVLFFGWATSSVIGEMLYHFSMRGDESAMTPFFFVILYFIVMSLGSSNVGKKVAGKVQKPSGGDEDKTHGERPMSECEDKNDSNASDVAPEQKTHKTYKGDKSSKAEPGTGAGLIT